MKILDRLDELRPKATKGPWGTFGTHVLDASESPVADANFRPDGDAVVNARRIALACNAEEAMVRVCRAAEDHIAHSHDPGDGRWAALAAEIEALREIEP